MSTLRDFVSNALALNRIRFADLRRLQRDVLPHGITTRAEAEVLIALDHVVARADADWTEYVVATVRDFVVWGSDPAGYVDRDKAEWLIAALLSGSSATARVIAREVVRDARETD